MPCQSLFLRDQSKFCRSRKGKGNSALLNGDRWMYPFDKMCYMGGRFVDIGRLSGTSE
jgi:hypothetical protein